MLDTLSVTLNCSHVTDESGMKLHEEAHLARNDSSCLGGDDAQGNLCHLAENCWDRFKFLLKWIILRT